jgi:membrane-associated phospholipid phosphatase
MDPTPSQRPTLARGVFQALLLAAIMFSSLGCYLLVLKWRGDAASVTTWTPADEWLPFWPSWVWVYLIPYIVGPVVIGLMTWDTFWWYVRRGLVVVGLTLSVFIVYPTQTDDTHRKSFQGTGLTAEMYKNMIEIDDPPANAAPSLHVSLTCLLALALVRDFPRWWPASLGFVALVWLSTLVTRQHHLIDVGTGALVACGVCAAFSFFSPAKSPWYNGPGPSSADSHG